MRKALYRFFASPIFPEDEDKTRSAAILNIMGWSTLLIIVGVIAIRSLQRHDVNLAKVNWVLAVVAGTILIMLFLIQRGFVRAASIILVSIVWIGLSYITWIADGIRDVAFSAYSIPILMAGLLLGWPGAVIFTVASILSGVTLAYAETNQLFYPTLDTPMHFARDMGAIFALIGILAGLMITSLQSALHKARAAAQELSISNKQLNELRVDLEERVEARTSDLKRRASQLEAVSSVARTITLMQEIDLLLPAITKLISEQFGYYHVGIFLVDEQQASAILRASNSEEGRQMLDRHYKLPLDHHTIVGYSIVHNEPRIALDVQSEDIYLSNLHLPETHSQIALPLHIAERVIGSLDVQSRATNAFSEEDIHLLTTLADQVAIAIENARLFSEAQKALKESRAMFEKYTQQEWSSFTRQAKQTGFVFDGKQIYPLDNYEKRESAKRVIQTGSLSLEKESASVAIPIRLRGQTIGVLDVRAKRGERKWKQDEITMLEAAAERAALALETARLVESAQRRAARERAIGDISAKIGAVSNLEAILQTAVEELGRKIGGATEVSLEISSDETQSDP